MVLKDGQEQKEHTRNVPFQGDFEHVVPLALNQEKGDYTVRATEIITGYRADAVFRVE